MEDKVRGNLLAFLISNSKKDDYDYRNNDTVVRYPKG